MHYINIHNKSGHAQEFEVHGWNNNKNIIVKAQTTAVIAAPDKTSGAIIALHDGHEGEQAEITKDGFEGTFSLYIVSAYLALGPKAAPFNTVYNNLTLVIGNDFIDLSNIVGAGGNLTVQQAGDNSTRKGDPLFMQHLNTAWHKADAKTKDSLKNCVHINKEGEVVRIDAIKDHPELEKFVRSFADGKTYIGVGAWGGSPGNQSDNNQVWTLTITSLCEDTHLE